MGQWVEEEEEGKEEVETKAKVLLSAKIKKGGEKRRISTFRPSLLSGRDIPRAPFL